VELTVEEAKSKVPVMAGAAVNVRVAPPVFVTVMDFAALVVFTP